MQDEYTAPPAGTMGATEARPLLIAEYGNLCFRCKFEPGPDDKPLAVDHIVPVAKGGQNLYFNYQLLCTPCNSWKGIKIIDFRAGSDGVKIQDSLPIIEQDIRARKSKPANMAAVIPVPYPVPSETSESILFAYQQAQEQIAQLSALCGHLTAALQASEAVAERLRADVKQAERGWRISEMRRTGSRYPTLYLHSDEMPTDARRAEAEERAARLEARRWWKWWT